jgi:hypothetical protein
MVAVQLCRGLVAFLAQTETKSLPVGLGDGGILKVIERKLIGLMLCAEDSQKAFCAMLDAWARNLDERASDFQNEVAWFKEHGYRTDELAHWKDPGG